MKILIDMSLTPKWRTVLESAGHEVKHWSDVGPGNTPDSVIMNWARLNGFVVFTNVLDFSSLLYAAQATGPSVLQIRNDDVRPPAATDSVLRALAEAKDALLAGARVTVQLARHRVSVLPLNH